MTYSLQQAWRKHAVTATYRSRATFTEAGLVLGADTLLASFVTSDVGLAAYEHDRLVAVLAVAGRGDLANTALLHIGQALADWRKGDRALAAIRLAFAKLPRLSDIEDACRLFLAEKALDAGLTPYELLAELGYAVTLGPMLKYPGQRRNPAGDLTGGRYASGRSGESAPPSIVPIFLDTKHKEEKPFAIPEPMSPVPSQESPAIGHDLDLLPPVGAPIPLPFLAPKVAPDEKEKEGPSCPAEAEDRRKGPNPAAEAWERFVHGIVNPSDPTKDGNAYYLPNPNFDPRRPTTFNVSYDDCKKTNELSWIPGIKRGDMVDGKDHAFNWLYGMPWDTSLKRLDNQLRRQNAGIESDGLGRHLFYCYDGDFAAALARMEFGDRYKNTTFLNCR